MVSGAAVFAKTGLGHLEACECAYAACVYVCMCVFVCVNVGVCVCVVYARVRTCKRLDSLTCGARDMCTRTGTEPRGGDKFSNFKANLSRHSSRRELSHCDSTYPY